MRRCRPGSSSGPTRKNTARTGSCGSRPTSSFSKRTPSRTRARRRRGSATSGSRTCGSAAPCETGVAPRRVPCRNPSASCAAGTGSSRAMRSAARRASDSKSIGSATCDHLGAREERVEGVGVPRAALLQDFAQLGVQPLVALPAESLEDVEDRSLAVHAIACVVGEPHGAQRDQCAGEERGQDAHLHDEPERRQDADDLHARGRTETGSQGRTTRSRSPASR